MSADAEMRLADGFAEADYDAWRDLVDKALKGADFDTVADHGDRRRLPAPAPISQ